MNLKDYTGNLSPDFGSKGKSIMKPYDCITDFIFYETIIEKSDIILIPGGSHPEQMIKAAELFHNGMAPYILPSGGVNSRLRETEYEYSSSIGGKSLVLDNSR